jgi:phosphoribosylaminoimidazole-succinocarboxamide synthase
MSRVLDIVPLRSLIAVADAGGFHRAAADLQLSQSAVSQHIRRLEKALGRPLVEPDGRRARLTQAGVALLAEARRIVAVHDEALQRLAPAEGPEFIIGTTDHAADHILPPIVTELGATSPALSVKFRFDRTTPLNEALDRGAIDLAVFITEASAQTGTLVGSLPLVWCAASGWTPPSGECPWPLIAIEEPCAIRGRALAILDEHGIPAKVVGEAAALGGVLNATRAGLGVSLLALAGPPPEGLVEVRDLPSARSISLTARARPGADQQAVQISLRVLQTTLEARPSTVTSDLTGGRSGTDGAAARAVVSADRLQLTPGGNRMELLHSGKIREVYADGDDILLVASDRVSVYDVVLPTLIPDKGKILTQLSLWWFDQLADLVPNHVISATDVPPEWAGRAIRCRRLDMLPVECIARGYLAGLGLESYQATRTISGVPLPEGLSEGSRLPEPVFTPTTKATVGHDEFIDLPEVEAAVGADTALELKRLTLDVYQRGAEIAAARGIIIADTKLEFGLAPDGTVVLADEVLTPDSSRFWSASEWQPGGPQHYLDKQFVRDWSSSIAGWDRKPPGPEVPPDIVDATRARYIEVYERLTGTQWPG